MPKFNISLRAIRHLTYDTWVNAPNFEAAQRMAHEKLAELPDEAWDNSPPEDKQIECIERNRGDD